MLSYDDTPETNQKLHPMAEATAHAPWTWEKLSVGLLCDCYEKQGIHFLG